MASAAGGLEDAAVKTHAISSTMALIAGVAANAVQEAAQTAAANARKRSYDRFLRRCGSKKHFRSSLAQDFLTDRSELYKTWTECDED